MTTDSPQTSEPAPWPWLVPLSVLPGLIACVQLGRLHPDEVYQWLEPAFFRAHGYGVLAWEWREGLRNWAVPGFFSWVLRLCAALGVDDPRAVRVAVALPQWVLHLFSLWAVFQYFQRRLGFESARRATFLVGLYAPVLTFAGRTLGESLSTSFLLLAIERMDRPSSSFRNGLWAGVFLGAGVGVRYPTAVLVLGCLAWMLWQRRSRLFWGTVLGGSVLALGLGALDAGTYGTWFHSLWKYAAFNLFSGEAARQFGSEGPFYYFLPWLWNLPLFGLCLFWVRRFPGLPLFLSVLYLLVVSATPHKELRFLYPALVLFSWAAAESCVVLLEKKGWAAAYPLALFLSFAPWFFDLGLSVQRPDQFQALVQATRKDATGLLIVNEGLWGAGGYFYIGKNIPFWTCDWPTEPRFVEALQDARINRALVYDDRGLSELQQAGFVVSGKRGRATWLSR